MKQILLACIFLPLFLISCEDVINAENGSGNVLKDTLYFDEIEKITNTSSGNIYYNQIPINEEAKVIVNIDDNLRKNVIIEIGSGKELKIKTSGSYRPTEFTIIVNSHILKELEINGSGNFSTNKVEAEDLQITTNGSGNLNVEQASINNKLKIKQNGSGDITLMLNKDLKELEISLNGSGDLNISDNIGKIQIAALKIYGSGDLQLAAEIEKLKLESSGSGNFTTQYSNDFIHAANIMDVELRGSGNVTAKVAKELKAKITGSGDLILYGNPNIDLEDYGTGELIRRN